MNRRTPNNSGFTLAEVLIAIAVITVGAMGLLAVCYSSLRHEREMLMRDDWHKVADYAVALLRQHDEAEDGFDNDDADADESAQAVCFRGEYPYDERWAWQTIVASDDTVPGLYRVTVEVLDVRESDNGAASGEDKVVYTTHTFYARRR